jgi:small-conductance mechanosensitive channel
MMRMTCVNIGTVLGALAMAYPYHPGAGTEAFMGLSVLVGVMVSIGGASVVGQAFSGRILMHIKSFRRDDFVRIGDSKGTAARGAVKGRAQFLMERRLRAMPI